MEPDPLSEHGPEFERLAVDTRIEALGEFCRQHTRNLLAFARRRLRREHIPECDYSAEDVVQSSHRHLIQDLIKGKVESIPDVDDFLRLSRRIIADKVMAELDRQDALKRGGSGIRRRIGKEPDSQPPPHHGLTRRERAHAPDDFNLFHSGLTHEEVDEISLAKVYELLRLLDPDHQIVARKRFQSCTIVEIARDLGVSTRTIDRRLERIRTIWMESGMHDLD